MTAEQTVLVPPVQVLTGTLDQVRLLLQPIVAIDPEGQSISFELPPSADLEGEGLKFFDEIEVCEDALTVVRWQYNFDSTAIDFATAESQVSIHPVVQSVEVIEQCVPFEPPGGDEGGADDTEQ